LGEERRRPADNVVQHVEGRERLQKEVHGRLKDIVAGRLYFWTHVLSKIGYLGQHLLAELLLVFANSIFLVQSEGKAEDIYS